MFSLRPSHVDTTLGGEDIWAFERVRQTRPHNHNVHPHKDANKKTDTRTFLHEVVIAELELTNQYQSHHVSLPPSVASSPSAQRQKEPSFFFILCKFQQPTPHHQTTPPPPQQTPTPSTILQYATAPDSVSEGIRSWPALDDRETAVNECATRSIPPPSLRRCWGFPKNINGSPGAS